MKKETQTKIDAAVETWRARTTKSLERGARQNYLKADARAWTAGISVGGEAGSGVDADDWMVIKQAALDYSKEYGADLTEKGGSTINGEFVPWMEDLEEGTRSEIADIINEGLEEGLPTGVKESGLGTYPKGSVAERLHEYFGERASHAAMVARTETARIQNEASLSRWDEIGITMVQVQDGDGANPCDACQELDGSIWTLQESQERELEHPNCVRSFIPLPPEEEG